MPRREPERTCLLTREARPASELMRFVLAPSGEVVADLRNRLPGRGAWLTPTADAVRQAVRRKLFPRAFKAEARAAPELADEVDAALLQDVRGALALANVASWRASADGRGVAALIHAREAAEDGRRKLAGSLRRAAGDTMSAIPVLDELSGDELDMALGRDNVIHAALLASPGSEGCLARWRRLRVFRGIDAGAERARDVEHNPGEASGPDR